MNLYTKHHVVKCCRTLIIGLSLLLTQQAYALPVNQYQFTSFNSPYVPLVGANTAGIYCDDCNYTGMPLGFTFNYGGTNYTTVSASSNGFLSLTNTSTATYTNSLGNAAGIGPMIMAIWDDDDTYNSQCRYLTTGVAPNRVFTFEWYNFDWPLGGVQSIHMQVKLYETSNVVEIWYQQGPNSYGGSASVGLYNSGSDYSTIADGIANPVPSTATFYTGFTTRPPNGTVYRWAPQSLTTTIPATNFCGGNSVNVSYVAAGIVFTAGNVITAQLSDATGSFASPTSIGTLTTTATSGTVAATIPANQVAGSQYRIRVVSSSPAVTGSDNGANITINPTVTPTISIAASPGNSICAGSNVTFTASITNGGTTPVYQWYVNASPVGGNSPTYSTTSLTNGQSVTCSVTSNAPCVSPATVTSSPIVMTVNPLLTPSVAVSSVPAANNTCVGQAVTFTATPTNGGPTPAYQWYINGGPVGSNSPNFTTSSLTNNDIVTCVMTSNAPCVSPTTATSPNVVVTVLPNLVPTINISANPGNSVCAGANTTFTATATNAGPTPTYQWYVGATPVGPNSPTYSTTTLVNGNIVKCVLTSNAPCATPATVTSNTITMTVNPLVTPTITVSANPGNVICIGTNTTFTASTTNAGPAPTYQWYRNGLPIGVNSATFASNALVNGDVITCTMTSSATCPSPLSVTSTPITMTVNNTVPASVGIAVSPGTTICSGSLTTFTASGVNGGPTPAYQWYKNGIPVGFNNPVYTDNGLNNGDVLNCTMTSNAVCAVPALSTSNNITMIVNPTVVPGISVSNNTGNVICAGTSVTFGASPINGGNAPIYQWYLNGNPVGGNSASYINNALVNGDAVYCTLTSNALCAAPATVTSSTTTMTVNALTIPSVSIGVSPSATICSGTSTTFTATGVNGGPSPSYQWYKNGLPVGNNPTYVDNALNNTDLVNCVMTSNATCATPPSVYSNSISMNVIGNVTPTVVLTATPSSTICAGSLATFTTQITNGGNNPVYQWTVNGNPVGTNSPAYADSMLANGDVVACEMTSSFTCATPSMATNSVTMTVNPVVTPAISIVSSVDTICRGGSITFNATPVNGGASPVYQWLKNGGPIGGPSATFTYNNFNDSDVVACNLLSSVPCPSPAIVTSNAEMIKMNEYMTPKVFLDADPNVLICSGAPLVFNASVDSAGTPTDLSYQWLLNGNPVGSNTPSYTGIQLNNGDMVSYIVTSTAPCLTKSVDTSKTDTVKWFNSGYLAGVTGTTESNTIVLTNQNTNIRIGYVDCDLISSIKPTGANPVAGNTTFKVTLDPQVNSYGGHPYLARHYDIEPQNNPSTATATIELYAYENEFRAYNNVAAAQWLPPLPTNKVDNGNTRITIFHGTGTAPGNYSGPTEEIPLSVSNTAGTDGFSMTAFPNPVQDKVEVKLAGKRGNNSSLVVTDLMGKTLINVEMDNNKAIIDMSGLASGMYMLHYSDDTRNETLKITKN